MIQINYKSTKESLKDLDLKNKVITGYLSSFGNKDYDNDIIEKGAFTKTINERKNQIFFLNQHDWKMPLGKFSVLREDEKGLYFESEPMIDTTYSNDLLKLYDAGIVKEHSIGFNVIKSNYSKDREANIIKEIKLYEGSAVTLGANSSTPFTGFKSLTIEDVKSEIKKITKAFRSGTFTDETFGLLEIALHDLYKQAFELGKQSLKDIDPLKDSQEAVKSVLKEQEILNNFIKNL